MRTKSCEARTERKYGVPADGLFDKSFQVRQRVMIDGEVGKSSVAYFVNRCLSSALNIGIEHHCKEKRVDDGSRL